jgi:hypothetical protein
MGTAKKGITVKETAAETEAKTASKIMIAK